MLAIVAVFLMMVSADVALCQTGDRAPEKCPLKVGEAPSVRGVKLGMTADELFALFPVSPGSTEEQEYKRAFAHAAAPPSFGLAHVDIAPDHYPNKEKFTGISWYFLTLLDGKTVMFTVQYIGPGDASHRGPAWPNLNDLVAKFSDVFHLPAPSNWLDKDGSNSKILQCNGFEVEVARPNDTAHLTVRRTSPSWVDELKKRRAAEEERLRREFKP